MLCAERLMFVLSAVTVERLVVVIRTTRLSPFWTHQDHSGQLRHDRTTHDAICLTLLCRLAMWVFEDSTLLSPDSSKHSHFALIYDSKHSKTVSTLSLSCVYASNCDGKVRVDYGERLSYAISPPVMHQSSSNHLQIMFKSFEVFEGKHQHAGLFQSIALMGASVSAAMLVRSTLTAHL